MLGENPSEEVDDEIFISIMNKSQEKMVFQWLQKLTSAVKQRPEK